MRTIHSHTLIDFIKICLTTLCLCVCVCVCVCACARMCVRVLDCLHKHVILFPAVVETQTPLLFDQRWVKQQAWQTLAPAGSTVRSMTCSVRQLDASFRRRCCPTTESELLGATRGVMVSMFAFPACHQCCYAGLSLAWGLNLWALVYGIFWSSSPGFSPGTLVSSPPSSVNGSSNKKKKKKS